MEPASTDLIATREGQEILRRSLAPGEYVIGREPGCDLYFDEEKLSRRHARLTIAFTHLTIEDLESSNGTFVNEAPVTKPTRLWPNQTIRVGRITLALHRSKGGSGDDSFLAPAEAAVQRLLPGEVLGEGRYEIGETIAQGGMGAILQAYEPSIDRKVAMKVMLDVSDEQDLTRFVTEGQITARLEHPNIVPVHELGVDEYEQFYYTMKLVRGITLRKILELLEEGVPETLRKYPLGSLLTLFQKVCDAVAYAHSKNIIHRDLKPANIMVGDFGEVLLMDWGLAKILGRAEEPMGAGETRFDRAPASPGTTLAGAIMGTPQYMAPEQARGEIERIDARTDVYALGAILYHLLCLRPPLDGKNPYEVIERVMRGDYDPLSPPPRPSPPARSHLPDGEIPASLAAVARKALALEPAERYASVPELQAEIEAYQNGFATGAEQAGPIKQLALLIRRNRGAALTAAAVLVLLVVFAVNVYRSRRAMETTLGELRKAVPVFHDLAAAEVESAPSDDAALPKALGQIQHAIDILPTDAEAYAARGRILETMLRLPEARQAFAASLALRPADEPARANLALCDELLARQGARSELDFISLRRLQAALQAEGRGAEAVVVGRVFSTARDQALVAGRARLTQAGIGRPLVIDDDGMLKLNLEDLQAGDFSFLQGIPLGHLRLTKSKIGSLAPLAGMPLLTLFANDVSVRDLSPLHGLPLVSLELQAPSAIDLNPLRGLPLERLRLGAMQSVKDWSFLRDLPRLRTLSISDCNLHDLAPLRGLKLTSLDVGRNPVQSLAALQGMPLTELYLSNTEIHSLAGVEGARLRNVSADGCRQLSDLSALRGQPLEFLQLGFSPQLRGLSTLLGSPPATVPTLQSLIYAELPEPDLGFVKSFPSLRQLRVEYSRITSLSPLEGTGLEELGLKGCYHLEDLAPIGKMKSLTTLSIPYLLHGVKALQELRGLRAVVLNQGLDAGTGIDTLLHNNQAAEVLPVLVQAETIMDADPQHHLHPSQVPGFARLFGGALQFHGKWYVRIGVGMPWALAERVAERLGGHLATVLNKEEDEFLIRSYYDKQKGGAPAWLGGLTDGEKKPWRWVTGEPWSYTGWLPGEPSATKSPVKGVEDRLGYYQAAGKSIAGWNDFFEEPGDVQALIVEWED